MKITAAVGFGQKRVEVSLAEAIDDSTDDYLSEGQLEQFSSKANNTAKLLGKLISALYENGKLTDKNIADMLSYRYQMENENEA